MFRQRRKAGNLFLPARKKKEIAEAKQRQLDTCLGISRSGQHYNCCVDEIQEIHCRADCRQD